MTASHDVSAPSLARRLRAGETVVGGWVGWTAPLVIEAVARSRLEAVVLDMQHGLHDPVSVMEGVTAIAAAGKPALVRVAVGDFAMASRALDMGAAGVIAPMINSVEDARAFASFVKYPPRGGRSWGAGRAIMLSGATAGASYLGEANEATLALAMIETREALAALDDILAVDGIDGVFVGPSDLSIALSGGAQVDPEGSLLDGPLARIVTATRGAGKIVGVFGGPGARAGELARRGFGFVTVGFDGAYLRTGIDAMLAAMD